MRRKLNPLLTLATAAVLGLASIAQAAPKVGEPAPTFTGTTSDGETVSLADLRGQTVVLEWTNHDCPYVRKHYETGNMQALQREATNDGIVWLSVISSAPGTQGHVSPAEANALTSDRDAAPSHVILDESGDIGRAYGAQTTPHMYVIDAGGNLVFMGGIDDKPSANHSTVDGAKNYVRGALEALSEGTDVPDPVTRPYGCSVKYS